MKTAMRICVAALVLAMMVVCLMPVHGENVDRRSLRDIVKAGGLKVKEAEAKVGVFAQKVVVAVKTAESKIATKISSLVTKVKSELNIGAAAAISGPVSTGPIVVQLPAAVAPVSAPTPVGGLRKWTIVTDPVGFQLPGVREANEEMIKKAKFDLRWARTIRQKHIDEARDLLPMADDQNVKFIKFQKDATKLPLIEPILFSS